MPTLLLPGEHVHHLRRLWRIPEGLAAIKPPPTDNIGVGTYGL